jgi:thiol-disulfide isomerase/thioredoxin
MKTEIERYIVRAAVGTVVVALAVVSMTAIAGWWRLRAAPAASYAVGDKIDLPPDAYSNAEKTLILFVRESCAVCQAEAPRLAELVRRVGLNSTSVASVVVTGSARVDDEREFAARFRGAGHRHLPFEDLRVKTVPTVVLVDRHGTILFAQEGRFSTLEMTEELIRRIGGR